MFLSHMDASLSLYLSPSPSPFPPSLKSMKAYPCKKDVVSRLVKQKNSIVQLADWYRDFSEIMKKYYVFLS